MNDTMVDIFSENNEDIEIITDEEVKNEQTEIIQNDHLENNIQENDKIIKKKDKVLMVQIILLVAWAILTAVIYFFGYDLFSPLIKVK